jgi:hypothetical protein
MLIFGSLREVRAGLLVGLSLGVASAWAQEAKLVAPPRAIVDIRAILDQEKPDPAIAAKLQNEANADEPATKDNRALAKFYYVRAIARARLGRHQESLTDCERAIALAGDFSMEVGRYEDWLGWGARCRRRL